MNPDPGRVASGSGEASSSTSSVWNQVAPLPDSRVSRPRTSTAACAPCKKAHLACDDSRPCRRCTGLAREESCVDVPSKKRGRPKLSSTSGSAGPTGKKAKPSSHPEPPSQLSRAAAATVPTHSTPPILSNIQPHVPYRNPVPSPHLPVNPSPSFAPNPQPSSFFPADFSLTSPTTSTSATLVTTTDLVIIRATSSSSSLLGYTPGSLYLQRLSSILSPEDVQTLEPVRKWLAEPPGQKFWTSAEAVDAVEKVGQNALMAAAVGSPEPANSVLLRTGDGGWRNYNLTVYLGSGAGLILSSPETFSRAYFVIVLHPSRPISPHTSISSSSSTRTATPSVRHFDDPISSPSSVVSPPIVPKDFPRPYTSSALSSNHNPSRPTLPPLSALTSSLDPHVRSRPYTSNTRHSNHPASSSLTAILSNPLSFPLPRPIHSSDYRPSSSAGDFNLPFSMPYDRRSSASRSSFESTQFSSSSALPSFHSLNLTTPFSLSMPTNSKPFAYSNPSSSSRPTTGFSQFSEQTVRTPGLVDGSGPWGQSNRGSYASSGSGRSSIGGDWLATGSGLAAIPYLDQGRRPSVGGYFGADSSIASAKVPPQVEKDDGSFGSIARSI